MLILTSCSTDDNTSNNVNNTSLLGDWEMIDVNYTGTQTVDFQGQTMTMDFSGQSVSFEDAIVVFNQDNTYTSSGSYVIELTVNFMGQSNTQQFPVDNFFGTGTWLKSGNTLTVTDDQLGSATPANIDILNATTLKLSISNYTVSMPGPGGNQDVDLDYEITLNKI
ncbi:hypothetical protein DNG35_03860 [Mesonia sp. K7]|nr:hypothetical protein DNG35_03860 [Mesonia sp. K7]